MKRFCLCLCAVVCVAEIAFGATREESTKPLKRVVYSGFCHDQPQRVDGGYYYARVFTPETSCINMACVTVYRRATYDGTWHPIIGGDLCGEVDIFWKVVDSDGYVSVGYDEFKIVIIYESGTTATATNTGSGSSVQLQWNTDTQMVQKITGYKVLRRPK